MRRVTWLVLPAVVVGAAVGVASARADGTGTTTTSTTTTGTTTTATTTTAPTPSFAPLSSSALPAACVGAGAAALVLPSQRVIAFGTPASNLGPSAYRSVVTFDSSAATGATCKSAGVTLNSVSLFDGAVTASSIQATDGRGGATGLAIDGSAITVTPGETVPVDGWGQLTVGETLGRVSAPLVLRLLQAHDSLPAGTAVVVAFAASAKPVAKPRPAQDRQATNSNRAKTGATKHARQVRKSTPDFPVSSQPITVGSLTKAARDNPVVSVAMRYLGIRYQWGGASPATGFDCSGLVKYVFGKLGVSLPHYAASQWYSPDAVWVAPNRLQPGDLVFFVGSDGTRKAPGHVGIYVDDGYIIDAPHTGSFVRFDSLGEPKLADGYVGAKRIVGAATNPRELSHSTTPEESTILPGFPSPLTIEPLSHSLGLAAASAAVTSPGPWWAGIVLGAVLLLLLAGGHTLHRRALNAGTSRD